MGKGHPEFIWKRHPDFGKRENPDLKSHLGQALKGLKEAVGIADFETVDKAYIGNFVGELFISQGHLGAALVGADPSLYGKPSMRVEGACASGGLAALCGVDAIGAGADVALITGVEIQTTASARVGGDYLARAADYPRQRGIDEFTFPALFARRAKHYLGAFDCTEEDIGRAAVKAYSNANRNPLAHMQARKVDLELAGKTSERNPHFLTNPEFNSFLRLTDCSQVSDGASAMILVSEEGLRKLGLTESDVIEWKGWGQSTANLYVDGDPLALETTQLAANRAYAMAGIDAQDVGIAEVHDCFTLTELLMYEAVGFAEQGEAATLLREGSTQLDGRLPVNSGGGLVGFGHPVGATGVKQIVEIWRQMKGRCGDYQVPNVPSWGLTANMGGDDKTAVVGLFENR
jgi:acetyl-CoA acyltransferase